MAQLYQTKWHDLSAWALESDALKVVIIPGLGAKIASLFDKRTGYEWLVGPMRSPKLVNYGASFTEQDMGGWDEMFPTINACRYPAPGEYAGISLPDHGEVWALPWEVVSVDCTILNLSVEGEALPYRLTRRTSLNANNELYLNYELENYGVEAMHYLWAAHPQFIADTDTIIKLPHRITQVVNVLDSETWGETGELYSWPRAVSKNGKQWQLDRIGQAVYKDCRKFYLPAEQSIVWAELVNPRVGCSMHMDWNVEDLPYFGLWVDEGAFNALPAVAPEPSNGYYDSLALAYRNKRVGLIHPGEKESWSLTVRLVT